MSGSIVVVGGGVEGLACAALLARAGRHVLLFEKRAQLGGLAAPEEFHDGFIAPGVSLDAAGMANEVIAELALESHGLRLRDTAASMVCPGRDGAAPVVRRGNPEQPPDGIPDADRAAWAGWRANVAALRPFLTRVFREPAPDIEAEGLGGLLGLARTGLSLRRLGRDAMVELLRVGPMCAGDWLGEIFDSPRLKALLAGPAVAGTWMGPWSAGTALLVLLRECMRGSGVHGGPAAVAAALELAAGRAGVELRTGCEVEEILVRDGAARGVRLVGGETLDADAVISSLDPRTTVLRLVSRGQAPPAFVNHLRTWRTRATMARLDLALEGTLEFAGVQGPVERAVLADDLDDLERAFDAVKYRESSVRPWLDLWVPSVADESLAPRGHATVCLGVHCVPHAAARRWSESRRAELIALALDRLAAFVPDVRERMLGSRLLVPEDIETSFGVAGGHIHHGELALDQLMHLRPTPDVRAGCTPVGGLILCGRGVHPGGELTGRPGRLAARSILAAP